MTERVAERLDADIILPASSVKPEYKSKPTLLKKVDGRRHAPPDSMELEIKPYALAEIEKVRAAFEGREFGSGAVCCRGTPWRAPTL